MECCSPSFRFSSESSDLSMVKCFFRVRATPRFIHCCRKCNHYATLHCSDRVLGKLRHKLALLGPWRRSDVLLGNTVALALLISSRSSSNRCAHCRIWDRRFQTTCSKNMGAQLPRLVKSFAVTLVFVSNTHHRAFIMLPSCHHHILRPRPVSYNQ